MLRRQNMSRITVTKTKLQDVLIVEQPFFGDIRGFFTESYSKKKFEEAGIINDFIQDNHSFNKKKWTLRGMHFQKSVAGQAKLVRVITGSVLDVVIDIRKNSPTYGQWEAHLLSAENKKQLYIPRGFAHGYLTLEDNTNFVYKCDGYYNFSEEAGTTFDDPDLNIDWGVDLSKVIASEKDLKQPTLAEYDKENDYEYTSEDDNV